MKEHPDILSYPTIADLYTIFIEDPSDQRCEWETQQVSASGNGEQKYESATYETDHLQYRLHVTVGSTPGDEVKFEHMLLKGMTFITYYQ